MTKKPVVLVIMDGVGQRRRRPRRRSKAGKYPESRPVSSPPARTTWLKAHGTAVGLPTDDDMGNSEVGHNALGCGQIYSQGAKLVSESIETGALFQSEDVEGACVDERTRTAMPCISSACCPTATSTRNISSPARHAADRRMAEGVQRVPTATSCSTAATCPPRPRSSMSQQLEDVLGRAERRGAATSRSPPAAAA